MYSVENNIITVKLLNKDGSVYSYYTLSFDKHYKPIIPSYFEIYPKDCYYEDMIISSLLNYTHRNPLKITRVDMVLNEFKEVYNINYTYKYNAKGLPTEIFKAKEMKNYLQGGSSGYSKQLIKIDYQ